MYLGTLNDALADFYSPGLATDTFVERTFTLTSRLLPFSLNSHGVVDEATGHLSANFDCDLPGLGDAFEAFGRYMGQYDAFRFDPAFQGGRPFSIRDVYSQQALADLDIYQEVYRPMRFVDHCFMHVPSDPGAVVFVGFMRDGKPFGPREKETLRTLQPHLANGRRLAHALTAAKGMVLSPDLFARAGFTPRECDVAYWITQGKATPDVARLLGVRADSVRRIMHAIYAKLGVERRGAATVRVLELARHLVEANEAARTGVLLRVPTSRRANQCANDVAQV